MTRDTCPKPTPHGLACGHPLPCPQHPTKQPNSWSCLATCAAMALGVRVGRVIDFVGHDGSEAPWPESWHQGGRRGFTLGEIGRFLASYSYTLGVVAGAPAVDRPLKLDGASPSLAVTVNLSGNPAIIQTVRVTKAGRIFHSIFWDGEKVLDPDPRAPVLDLSQYDILSILPVIKLFDWTDLVPESAASGPIPDPVVDRPGQKEPEAAPQPDDEDLIPTPEQLAILTGQPPNDGDTGDDHRPDNRGLRGGYDVMPRPSSDVRAALAAKNREKKLAYETARARAQRRPVNMRWVDDPEEWLEDGDIVIAKASDIPARAIDDDEGAGEKWADE